MKLNVPIVKKKPFQSNQSDQILIRGPRILKSESFIKDLSNLDFINFIFKKIKKSSKTILPKNSIFLVYQFLTECGKIRPRMAKHNIEMKKYKIIKKLIKRAREFKIIPSVYKMSL